jgi:hypothetical protein
MPRLGNGGGETVKPEDPRLAHYEIHLIAAPQTALEAATNVARGLGLTAHILSDRLEGERVRLKGVMFAVTPASDFVCGTMQAACGIILQVFTTGRGTPYGLAMLPVIKMATRHELARRRPGMIDIDAGGIATGEKSIKNVG